MSELRMLTFYVSYSPDELLYELFYAHRASEILCFRMLFLVTVGFLRIVASQLGCFCPGIIAVVSLHFKPGSCNISN